MYDVHANPQLILERCPHCQVAKPTLVKSAQFQTRDHTGRRIRDWHNYACSTCGGVVLASTINGFGLQIEEMFPEPRIISDSLPGRAKDYLSQAIASIHAPSGAVMLAASAVDAMLKEKGYKNGSLYSRIEASVNDNIITEEMGAWAHEVRLDANGQRHSDDDDSLPDQESAEKVIEFASALGEFLFVLPARVQRGRAK